MQQTAPPAAAVLSLHPCWLLVVLLQSDDRVDKIPEFRQIAASLQPVKAALSGSSQRSVGSQLPAPLKREIGDCYLWGSWSDAEVGGRAASVLAGLESRQAAQALSTTAYPG